MANRGTSVDGGWKLVSFGLCVFSGSFGVRSIVLCKCSGKVLIGSICYRATTRTKKYIYIFFHSTLNEF